MFQINSYIEKLLMLLKEEFGERLVYLGLQGSYLRNEQNENSDIDIMAVIDEIKVGDLERYRDILIYVGYYEKSCGFICGKKELAHWNPLEICDLLYATKDIYGTLSEYVPRYTAVDIKNFVKLSVGNLYHELGHRFIHADREKSRSHLPGTYKQVFFILQNLTCLRTGVFYGTKSELLCVLEGQDKDVLEAAMNLQSGQEFDFEWAFELLFSWCGNTLTRLDDAAA